MKGLSRLAHLGFAFTIWVFAEPRIWTFRLGGEAILGFVPIWGFKILIGPQPTPRGPDVQPWTSIVPGPVGLTGPL